MRLASALVLLTGCAQILGIDDPTDTPRPPVDSGPMTKDGSTKPDQAHQYWRFQVDMHSEANGGSSIVMTEVQMRFGDGVIHGLDMASLSVPFGGPADGVEPHTKLEALSDGDFTTRGGTDYVSFFDGGTIQIDLGAPRVVPAIELALSGVDMMSPTGLDWTPFTFSVCFSDAPDGSFTCTSFQDVPSDTWRNEKPSEFVLTGSMP